MNKILGIISVWGAEKWIKLSIEQALTLCDEVVVNTGPYVANMAQFEDKTKQICQSYGNRIKLVTSIMSKSHAEGKAATLNKILRESALHKEGNWIWLFDVDEYYIKEEFDKIKPELFSGKYNTLKMDELYFFINTKRYLKNKRIRLWRIGDMDSKFVPTNRWTGARNKIFYDPDFKYFHYSTLMDQRLKKELYKTERNEGLSKEQHEKVEWTDKIYMKYDLNNEDTWITLNQKLYGVKQPYWRSDFAPDTNGRLFVYNGPHPKLIKDAGLCDVEDFRI